MLAQVSTNKLMTFLIFTCLNVACVSYSDPESVATSYVEVIYDGDVKKFKKLVEERDYRSSLDYKLFIDGKSTGRLETLVHRKGISNMKVSKSTINKNRSSVKIQVLFNDKTIKNLVISLHKKQGRWYVDPMSWARW